MEPAPLGNRVRVNRTALLGLPALLLLLAFFVLPMLTLLRISFDVFQNSGQEVSALTTDNYVTVLTDHVEFGAIGRTIFLTVVVTTITVLASYPMAYFLARTQNRWRSALLTLAVAPLLTADIVRVYGWLILLGSNGIVNSSLLGLGLIHEPLSLVYNETGTIIGLVEIVMPYAILTLFSTMVRSDVTLEEAASSLGAGHVRTFLRVTLPMSLPGVAVASLLVVVLTISSYITPSVLGGGRVFTVAVEIFRHATVTLDWPLASALAVVLLGSFALALVLYARMVRWLDWRVQG